MKYSFPEDMDFHRSELMLIFGIMIEFKKVRPGGKETLHIKIVIFIHKTVFHKWKFSGQNSVKWGKISSCLRNWKKKTRRNKRKNKCIARILDFLIPEIPRRNLYFGFCLRY